MFQPSAAVATVDAVVTHETLTDTRGGRALNLKTEKRLQKQGLSTSPIPARTLISRPQTVLDTEGKKIAADAP